MRHSSAREIVRDALRSLMGREPTAAEVANATGVAHVETLYGRSQQFGKLAARGLFNWGAHERSRLADGTCMAGTAPGSDVGGVCFYVFATDDEAALDYLRLLVRNKVPLSGTPHDVAAGMYRVGYFGGFHWAPGCKNERFMANDPRGIQVADCDAEAAANIASYAQGITNGVRAADQNPSADPTPGAAAPVRSGGASSWSLGQVLGATKRQWAIGGVAVLALGGVAYLLASRGQLGREPARVAGNIGHILRNMKAMVL